LALQQLCSRNVVREVLAGAVQKIEVGVIGSSLSDIQAQRWIIRGWPMDTPEYLYNLDSMDVHET
jgi:hypothetical protein